MSTDEKYMQRCLELAKLGQFHAAPNPMVGCVIVRHGEIIGEGYHEKCGEAHAEVNAIRSVKDEELLKDATLYVNLEPCAHFGKTPPCSNLIIDKKIPKVVIGCMDSYSEVAGKGIERMRAAGIEVIVGILEKESLTLNKRFFTFHTHQRPYVILKWAQTANGFMDKDRSKNDKGIFWITQAPTKSLVHQWRAEEAGILVGHTTIEVDNPSLTCRQFYGKNPIRIIIDSQLKTDYSQYTVGLDGEKTIVFCSVIPPKPFSDSLSYIQLKQFDLNNILHQLYQLDIQSIIVEGGAHTLKGFIDLELWDEARMLIGVSNLENGILAPSLHGTVFETMMYGKDQIKWVQPIDYE